MSEVFIYYGNHKEGIKPIHDLVELVKKSFLEFAGISNVSYSSHLVPNKINIIIEEFSNKEKNSELLRLKKLHPKTSYLLILTEVPINGAYNNFDNLKANKLKFFIKMKVTRLVYLLHPIIKFFFDLLKIDISSLTTLIRRRINFSFAQNQSDHSFTTLNYFKKRYIGTKYLIKKGIFSKIYTLGTSAKNLTDSAFGCDSTEFPYYILVDRSHKKSNLVMFSGTMTDYRSSIFNKLHVLNTKINQNLDDELRNNLSTISCFSFHIPRYHHDSAHFSSPTRTLHALKNGMIPIFYNPTHVSTMEELLELPIISKDFANVNILDLPERLESYYYQKIDSLCRETFKINQLNKAILQDHIKALKI